VSPLDIFQQVRDRLTWTDITTVSDTHDDRAYCEIHGDNNTPDLKIYEDGNWKCHACGATGQDIIRYVAQRDNINDYDAAIQLIENYGLDVDTDESDSAQRKRRERQRIRRIQEQVVEAAHTNLTPAKRQDLKDSRNWTDETIHDCRIGWMNDDLFNTLKTRHGDDLEAAGVHYGMTGENGCYLIPHLRTNGTPYLITARDPAKSGDDEEKYMQSKNTDYVSNDIYILQQHRSDALILTEGYPDAISAHQAGYDVVAAGCGSFDGEYDRLTQLAESYEKVVIILDNDPTGQENLHSTAKQIATETTVKIHEWNDEQPEKYDLDDWTTEHGNNISALIEPADDYLSRLISTCDSRDRTKRAEAKNRIFHIIEDWQRSEQDEVLRDLPGDFESNRAALDEFCTETAAATGLKTSIDWDELEELYADDNTNKIHANDEMAKRLLQRYDFRALRDTEEIWVFNDPIYEPGGEQLIRQLVQKKLGRYIQKRDTNEIIEKIRTQTLIDRPDPQKYSQYIALENGIYNIETGELEPGDPDKFLVNQCPVEYDEDADCPNIKEFLTDIVREEDIVALQEMMGYALLADQPFEKAWMLLGSGENGKSTFLNLLTKLIGEENVVSPSLHRLMNNKYARATLYGKLANINADLSEKALQHTGIFKQLTGGDQIQAEEKYKPSFEFWNTATLIYAANKLPKTRDTTDAFFRRWIIIEFPYKFTDNPDDNHKDKDPRIEQQLYQDEELSGLLNFALTGLERVLEQGGFSDTQHMDDIKQEWLRRTNPLMAFTEHYTEHDPDCIVPKKEFANAVREFCRDKGAKFPTNKTIGEDLPGMVDAVATIRPDIGGQRPNCWEGIRVTGEYANQIDQYERDGAGYRRLTYDDDDEDPGDGSGTSGDDSSPDSSDSSKSSNNNVKDVKAKSTPSRALARTRDPKNLRGVENCPDNPDINETTERSQQQRLSPADIEAVCDTAREMNNAFTVEELADETGLSATNISRVLEEKGEFYKTTKQGHWQIL